MAAIDQMTAGRGFVLGFLLSAVNPKNLLMAVARRRHHRHRRAHRRRERRSSSLVFVAHRRVLGGRAGDRLPGRVEAHGGPLEALRGWLVQNNATVMAVLLLVIGVVLVGKGIGSF